MITPAEKANRGGALRTNYQPRFQSLDKRHATQPFCRAENRRNYRRKVQAGQQEVRQRAQTLYPQVVPVVHPLVDQLKQPPTRHRDEKQPDVLFPTAAEQ
ncbi:MAG: hypothetical protein GYA59_04050 [Chloroflexi bacterium]|nr:hypothetical protein [Chloroflexota bacterium]